MAIRWRSAIRSGQWYGEGRRAKGEGQKAEGRRQKVKKLNLKKNDKSELNYKKEKEQE